MNIINAIKVYQLFTIEDFFATISSTNVLKNVLQLKSKVFDVNTFLSWRFWRKFCSGFRLWRIWRIFCSNCLFWRRDCESSSSRTWRSNWDSLTAMDKKRFFSASAFCVSSRLRRNKQEYLFVINETCKIELKTLGN